MLFLSLSKFFPFVYGSSNSQIHNYQEHEYRGATVHSFVMVVLQNSLSLYQKLLITEKYSPKNILRKIVVFVLTRWSLLRHDETSGKVNKLRIFML